MLPVISAVLAFVFLGLAMTAKGPGTLALALLACLISTITSLVGFVQMRVGARQRDAVYIPTPEELALLQKRAERQREAHAQQRGAVQPPAAQTPAVRAPGSGTPPGSGPRPR